jgi:hypothetical protein
MVASYFIDGLTLARVAKLLGVHESTISRRLDQVVRGLRRDILARLEKSGMSARQAEEALDVDVRDLTLDIRRHLTQDSARPCATTEKTELRWNDFLPSRARISSGSPLPIIRTRIC